MPRIDPVLIAAGLRSRWGLGTDYVDVFEVLRAEGVELFLAPFHDGLEGAHMVREGRTFVFVNTACAITRQRLTAAHELGHHVLEDHATDGSLFEESTADHGNDPEERAAYTFARYFLMDPDGVRRITVSIKDQEERVAAVASRFVTSIDVTCIHLAGLGVITNTTKKRLLDAIHANELRPAAFLQSHGYELAPTPAAERPVLDARYIKRAIEAYGKEWVTLASLADLLGLARNEAVELLGEHGLAVRNDN
jgi:Zn-dependent peptidase ImmA (M78 family)